jgi:hypothetical protein
VRTTFVGICIVALLVIVPVRAFSQVLVVDPESGLVQVDDEFEVDILVDAGFVDLMGYDITIVFNSSIIELIGATEGPLPQSAAAPTFFWWAPGGSADTVVVNGAVLGTTVDGPGNLFTLTFKAKEVGTTQIAATFSDIRTGTNTAITHTIQSATVIVDDSIPVEQTTWGRVKYRYGQNR